MPINNNKPFTIEGTELNYPTRFHDGCSSMGIFPVSSRKANSIIADTGFKAAEFFPGIAMMTLVCVNYTDTECGSYLEIALAFVVKNKQAKGIPYLSSWLDLKNGKNASYSWALPVTTRLSRDAGISMWGFPKTVEDISHTQDDKTATFCLRMDNRHVLSYTVETRGTANPKSGVGTVYSIFNGKPHVSYLKNTFRNVGYRFRGGELTLGNHPFSEKLRQLLITKKPLLAIWNAHLNFEMSAPEQLLSKN